MTLPKLHIRDLLWLVFATQLPVLCSCDTGAPRPGSPPLSVHYRKAQLPGKGLVAGIENESIDETLSEFVVKVSSTEDQRSYRIGKSLRPEDSMTIGWVELDGWELKPGDELSITCKQYASPAKSTVRKP